MKKGYLLAAFIVVATVILIVIGTIWPVETAVAYAGGKDLLRSSTTPQAAVENLGMKFVRVPGHAAYASLGNKAEFTQDAV